MEKIKIIFLFLLGNLKLRNMNPYCVCGMKDLLSRNKFFYENRQDLNKIIMGRVLTFSQDDIFGTLRLAEHYEGGKIILHEFNDVSALQKLVNNLKRPVSDKEKDERIRKMGETISELNRRLKEKS